MTDTSTPSHKVTRDMLHAATEGTDTIGKRGGEQALSGAAPPPPDTRGVSNIRSGPTNELMLPLRLAVSASNRNITSPHNVANEDHGASGNISASGNNSNLSKDKGNAASNGDGKVKEMENTMMGREMNGDSETSILQRLSELETKVMRALEMRAGEETRAPTCQAWGKEDTMRTNISCPKPMARPMPPPPPKDSPHHTVTLSLSKTMEAGSLQDLVPKVLTRQTQDAIHGCGTLGLESIEILGVQVSSKSRIKVYVKSELEAATLLETLEAWLPKLAPEATLVLKTPENSDDVGRIFDRNPDVTPVTVCKRTPSAWDTGSGQAWTNASSASNMGTSRIDAHPLIPYVHVVPTHMIHRNVCAHMRNPAQPIGTATSHSSVLSVKELTQCSTNPAQQDKKPSTIPVNTTT
ncbi:hypothetical protein IW262DRAFT_1299914 [Armillaria fumosa]|nr:hypothetical protein IW262DRAFT_1299914 [Armillaria fumosa]